ncbi:guanylate kinase [Methylobacillus sp.]|uniref:guanylate kinase n=1 Tax=Methylobacillus sp. TaxID=56818 RepID=UPI00257BEA05|nr:guanylate kinase [Methylobacillus sp.]
MVTLTGMTCSGKSTLERRLVTEGYSRIISTTTRKPRPGEVDGKDYYFVSNTEFLEGYTNGGFVEVAHFAGNHYGATKAEFERVLALGNPVVIVVEPSGRDQIVSWGSSTGVTVIQCNVEASAEKLAQRFIDRMLREWHDKGNPNWEGATSRLTQMLGTEQEWGNADYDVRVVMNNIVDEGSAYALINALVKRANSK